MLVVSNSEMLRGPSSSAEDVRATMQRRWTQCGKFLDLLPKPVEAIAKTPIRASRTCQLTWPLHASPME